MSVMSVPAGRTQGRQRDGSAREILPSLGRSRGAQSLQRPSILLLDIGSEKELGESLSSIICSSGEGVCVNHEFIEYRQAGWCGQVFPEIISRTSPDIIFFLLSADALLQLSQLVSAFQNLKPGLPIVAVIPSCQPEDAAKLLELGVTDFLTPPLKAVDILPRLWRLLQQAARNDAPVRGIKQTIAFRQLIGQSQAFLAQVEKLPLMASCDASVLILGETGTGKELCARALHYLSPRKSYPLIPVNCSAIPTDLVENELFGHERGAFTGAATSQVGLVQEADRGTLFLDEIDCLPQMAQAKLLRFVQEKEYRPLGSPKLRHADVRLIAASNGDIEQTVRDGKLRRDLYYRLNVITLNLPPLRERHGDIPLLAHHFLKKYAAEFRRPAVDLADGAMQRLSLYPWPGNVRELEHVIERAVALAVRPVLQEGDLNLPSPISSPLNSFREAKAQVIVQFERNYLNALLVACQGNITRAAEVARKDRRAFWELIRKHRIDVRVFKEAK
jgi:two-component system response regulator GlrR